MYKRQDCPLIAPDTIDEVIKEFLNAKCSYASNTFPYTRSEGQDVEVFSVDTLRYTAKNAFEEIALQQSTNLAVVAPGIAEALLATALGLLAAIPAVIFYNKLSGDSDKIIAEQESFADEFLLILSRQLESLENRKT